MTPVRGTLPDAAAPDHGERFVELARLGGTTIEHIVSSTRPDDTEQDQPRDEWVVLLHGTAELEVGGTHVSLTSGQWLLLPAHTRHRVLATSEGARWLAVHVRQT